MDEVGSGEFGRCIVVWFTVFACLTYCYFISKSIPKGLLRLISVFPIISIFTLLPLYLHSLHFTFLVGFLIAWLANFKLLLFSFDMGPLSSNPHSLSSSSMTLPLFIFLACLPIKIKQNPFSHGHQNGTKFSQNKLKSTLYYSMECLLLGLVLCVYEYKQYLSYPSLTMKFLYALQTFLSLEIHLAIAATVAHTVYRLEVEPQFNHPYFSTSIQNFWGRRWNLVVSSILHSTVYKPVRRICTHILGRSWSLYVAIVATFAVSGIMHELLLFYMGRQKPVWDMMWFFVLNGICLSVEIAVKKALKGRWRLKRLVSTLLSILFLAVTSFWLFFPSFERITVDVITNQEICSSFKGVWVWLGLS